MAVFQSIKNFFAPEPVMRLPEAVVDAPPTEYSIKPVTQRRLAEITRLNLRCFRQGENYSKHTFNYLLNEPRALSYMAETTEGAIAGFVFVLMNQDGAAHITTLGVAPEHRRRGIARRMLLHLDRVVAAKSISTIMLEVRVSNLRAQQLYTNAGYMVVQRVSRYYNNGEDGYLMMKSLV